MALVALAAELLPWGHEFLPRCPRASVYPTTPSIAALQRAPGPVLAVTERQDWGFGRVPPACLPPNAATVYGYDSVSGYDSLFPRSYRSFIAAAEGTDPAPLANGNMVLPERAVGPLQALAGLTDALQATAEGGVALQTMPGLPRAFVVRDAPALAPAARQPGLGGRGAGARG